MWVTHRSGNYFGRGAAGKIYSIRLKLIETERERESGAESVRRRRRGSSSRRKYGEDDKLNPGAKRRVA